MERTPEIFEKIEGYLTNTLPQEELIAFEKALATNQELQEEVEKHRMMHNVLGDQDTLDFKEKLARISTTIKEEEEEKIVTTSSFSLYWKVAASIVIVFGAGTLYWYISKSQNKTQNLYGSYYQAFPAEDNTRGNTTNEIQKVIKQYTNGVYDSVVIALENYPNLETQKRLQLYLGNSYLNLGQEKKAINQFTAISETDRYYEIGQWYLSLSYLKLNKPKKTIPILEEIIAYNGVYKAKAMKLLKELRK
ncbi:tol-pal system YbgF family protein [Aquimarina sp. AU119]|uniref:tetratricopeptide repeat protein n=1 Tax=Aquimarina sp. AU119 TaxID=2108528 RepID=UPI000D6A031A|nr:hypothetical protein [Aquimarina sp. AU119]